jgi:hypothetical protein
VLGSVAIATTRKLTYDHAGRLLKTEHKIDSDPYFTIAENEYNELGQLITKKQRNNTTMTTPGTINNTWITAITSAYQQCRPERNNGCRT